MSTTIDQRVVEMRFDNRHFERNVATTMSTVEKLKQKLNFSGAAKGIENIDAATKKVNMTGLGSAVDTVRARFSALEVIGVTALANITNSAVNAGKRIISALTIDPIKTGFQEYETQMNSVQTILANTQSKGSTLDDVNQALDTLNTYADQTIYNFTEMTRNIGTFTAAGVDLQTSVDAIKGIANLAAVSGSSSTQASTAMYQLSQALAAGKVSLMDWNSVVNAGMGGELFQNALIRTSELLKTGAKDAIKTYGSFRESLTKGEWLTTEVLTETLKQLSGAYTEADLIAKGFTKDQAKEITSLAQTASDAATKVKTFTQLWDVLKESAQSGWAQTWKIVVGDFEEAKAFFSPLAETLTSVINKFSDARNNMLKGALTSKWDQLSEKVEKAGLSTDTFLEKIKETAKEGGISVEALEKEYGSLAKAIQAGKIPTNVFTKALRKLVGSEEKATKSTKELGDVVKKVLNGEFGTGEERVKKLTEAGYDYAEVQNKVNEKLGSSIRHLSKLTEEQKKNADQLSKLSDEQLKNKGYTEEQITALRELESAAKDGNTSINELIESMDKPSGRTLLLESFNKILELIGETLGIVKEAWDEVFHPDGDEAPAGEMLYNIIETIHDFTMELEISEEKAAAFKNIMKGLFDGLTIGNLLVSKTLVSGLKILDAVLDLFSTDLLGLAEKIALCVSKFKAWLDENTMLYNGIDKIAKIIVAVIEGIGRLVDAFMELEIAKDLIEGIKKIFTDLMGSFSLDFSGLSADDIVETISSAFDKAVKWIESLDTSEAARDFVQGFVNGIGDGIGAVVEAVAGFARSAIETLCGVLGIQSPSVIAFAIGAFFIAGFILGMQDSFEEAWSTITDFASQCVDSLKNYFQNISWGKVFAAGVIITALWLFKKLIDVVGKIVSPIASLNDMFKSFGNLANTIGSTIKGIGTAIEKHINAKTLNIKSKAILNFALAIGILAGSIWVLSKIPIPDLIKAGIAIGVLAGIMAGLIVLTSKFNKGGDITIKSASILAIAVSLIIIAGAFKILETIDIENVPTILSTFAIAIGGLLGLVYGFEKITSGKAEASILKMGGILTKISIALLLMVGVVKLASSISMGELKNGIAVVGSISLLFAAMTLVTKFAGNNVSKAGGMMIKMSVALLTMVGVIKLAAMLDRSEINRAIDVMTTVGILFAAIIAVSQFAGKYASKAGGMIFKMSLAIAALVLTIKMMSKMSVEDINKGIKAIAKLEIMFAGLIAVSKLAGPNAAKAGVMLLLMSGALLILSGVIFILSEIGKENPEGLWRAVEAIAILEIAFMGLIAVTKYAKDCKANLIVLTVAVGILAMFLTALSFIEPADLRNATACISTVMIIFGGLMLATKMVKNTASMRKTLIQMIVIVGLLGLLMIALSYIDTDKALKATAALSLILLSFSGAMMILSKSGRMSSTVSKKILPMLGVVAALALIVAGLSLLEPGSVMTSVTALSMLMLAFAGSLTMMSKAGRMSTTVSKQIYPMLGVVAILALILSAMAQLPNSDALLPAAVSLGILLAALAGSMVILSNVGPATTQAVKPAALMGLVVGELAIILGLLTTYAKDVDSLLPTATALSILLLALSAACLILAPLGATGPAALAGAGILAGVIAILGIVAIAIGELMRLIPQSKIDQWKEGIDKLMDLLSTLTYGLGKVIGSFVGGFTAGAFSGLPEIGKHLSDFMTNAQIFIDGAKSVDGSVLKGVGILAGSVAALTVADVMNSFAEFLTNGSTFADLGTQLSSFMTNAQPFIEQSKNLDPAIMEGVKSLAEAILILTSADILDALTSWATGGTSFGEFGSQLASFGKSLQDYSAAVAGVDGEAVKASADAAKALIKVADAIPNMGGLASMFAGDNTMDMFGAQLVSFGASLKAYSLSVVGIQSEPILASAEAARALAAMADTIPNMGGMIAWFSGDNKLATFGSELVIFGDSLKSYSTAVTGLAIEPITNSVAAAKSLASIYDSVPNLGGLMSWFAGETSLTSFGVQIVLFAKCLTGYADAVADLDTEAINKSVKAARALANLGSVLPADGVFNGEGVSNFGKGIKGIAGALEGYEEKVASLETGKINTSISTCKKLLSFINSTASIDSSGVATFKKAVSDLANTNFKGLAENMSAAAGQFVDIGTKIVNALAKGVHSGSTQLITSGEYVLALLARTIRMRNNDFQTLGSTLMTRFISGMDKNKAKAANVFNNVLRQSVARIRANYSGFYNAGSYLAIGFANGISASAFAARARAAAMAQSALNAARATLNINSPSRESRKLGVGFGEGFVYGIQDYMRNVRSASTDMADTAIDGFGGAIAKVSDMLGLDIDSEPTIRPVLDLSDISAGANAINNMLGFKPSVGVLANVGAINTMRNRRNQNGINDDVVAAIEKLRGDVGNINGNSYTIGNVTYEDGSAIADAIQTIVRYAKIERRV